MAEVEQVGGDHYASEYQHWDFVTDTHQSYPQGCATKYVTRWRKKGGVEDLKKALSYVAKARSVGLSRIPVNIELLWRFAAANKLLLAEGAAIWAIIIHEWDAAEMHINLIIRRAEENTTFQPI